MQRKALFAIMVVVLLLLAGGGYLLVGNGHPSENAKAHATVAMPPAIAWDSVYAFNKQGYEPGLVVDSQGYMYYTAHKNLDDKTSWDYLASWFFVGSQDGKSWKSPSDPPMRGQKWKTEQGDEGDIAVDANDRVYFVDTYLVPPVVDCHIHVFDSPGVWQYSVRVEKTTGMDDRPWMAAQGSGILNYLGNNGMVVNGGRYWCYRSTDGGRVFSRSTVIPGNGWAHIDGETGGTHTYIIDESDSGVPADILVYPSTDSGATWDFNSPVVVGHRDGPGVSDGFPVWISAGPNGTVWCMWSDADSTPLDTGSRVFLGWSRDYGQTWNTSEITPWKGLFMYPNIDVGEDGTIGVAFYATDSLPVTNDTEWHIYGAVLRPESPFHPWNSNFTFQSGAMQAYRQYEANRTKATANLTALNGTLFFKFTRGEEGPVDTGTNLHDLHDFFEIAVGPDDHLNIAYQHYIGPANGHSELYFVRGTIPQTSNATASTKAG